MVTSGLLASLLREVVCSRERWNQPAVARVLQASRFRCDVTALLNAAAGESGSERAFRRNTAEHVYTIEAAHNPEVAGSNPAPATGKGPARQNLYLWPPSSRLCLAANTPNSRSIARVEAAGAPALHAGDDGESDRVASGAVRDLLLARGSWRAARTGRRSRRTGVPQCTETRSR